MYTGRRAYLSQEMMQSVTDGLSFAIADNQTSLVRVLSTIPYAACRPTCTSASQKRSASPRQVSNRGHLRHATSRPGSPSCSCSHACRSCTRFARIPRAAHRIYHPPGACAIYACFCRRAGPARGSPAGQGPGRGGLGCAARLRARGRRFGCG
ncbi:hypothetical protein FA95DRAFT_1043657 [Auriscalpium vulgare]|uniref:Uncharacterized protein n=1 Tax=Auriscalpium vulgare TaxID=40419 RepID=A0ACB8R5R7_9AGAM|nr:hypothetical protein FA95DRAFT_1043657 [Auriscalpium vulgare]